MRLGTYYRSQFLKHLNLQATHPYVLDVGAFDGYWLSTQKARHKYALDIHLDPRYKNIHYIQHSALHIPLPANKFNRVYAFDVLEHITKDNEKQFLKELLRVCKCKGHVILTTPSKNIRLFPPFLTSYISHKWGHAKCLGYSRQELATLLSIYDYHIQDHNAPLFRLTYLITRILWIYLPRFTRKLISFIAYYDSHHTHGSHGYYLIDITKHA